MMDMTQTWQTRVEFRQQLLKQNIARCRQHRSQRKVWFNGQGKLLLPCKPRQAIAWSLASFQRLLRKENFAFSAKKSCVLKNLIRLTPAEVTRG